MASAKIRRASEIDHHLDRSAFVHRPVSAMVMLRKKVDCPAGISPRMISRQNALGSTNEIHEWRENLNDLQAVLAGGDRG
jgi:hypothetical protein